MYHHEKHAGSVFDIFKHACLINLTKKYTPKVYFESHCGFAYYYKPERWESSWLKILRKTKCDCILCDTNPDVGNTLPNGNITFKNTDGFQEAHELITSYNSCEIGKNNRCHYTGVLIPDLFFIDPSYKDPEDWTKTARLIRRLQDTDRKWAVWYPLFKEAGSFIAQHPTVEMHWCTEADMYGCGMIFGGFKKKHLNPVYDGLFFLQNLLSGVPVYKKYKYLI